MQRLAEDLVRLAKATSEQYLRVSHQSDQSMDQTAQIIDNISMMIAGNNQRQKDELEDISVRMAMSGNSTQARLQQQSQQIKMLELSKQKQDERIRDLESRCRVHTEERQQQREMKEQLRHKVEAEVERCRKAMLGCIQKAETDVSEKVTQADKRGKEKMESLEAMKKEQEWQNEVLQEAMQQLIEEMMELREQVEQLKERKPASKSTGIRARSNAQRISRMSSTT